MTASGKIVIFGILMLVQYINSLILEDSPVVEDIEDGIPLLESSVFEGNEQGNSMEINKFAKEYGLKPFHLSARDSIDIVIPEDAKLDFNDIVKKYGHTSEEHSIVSKDGYITKLFHLPGNKKRPVLMFHGLFDACNTYVIRGNDSLGISLANAGYDVWLGNMRGNKHSRKHKTLDPDRDPEYWDFSYHEMALHDLPPTIDYILKQTGQRKIYVVSHSLGNNLFFVLTSTLPKYNHKIRILVSLAPAVYIENIKLPTQIASTLRPLLNYAFKSIGKEEIFPDTSAFFELLRKICPIGLPGYIVCAELIFFYITGYHESELERDFLQVAINQSPSGSSRKNFFHLGQAAKYKRFARYDAGLKQNLRLYGSEIPPIYNLSAVTMKVAIFAGKNDKLVAVKDTERLRCELKNVVEYKILKPRKTNHLDFVWGKNARDYLFPYIFDLLKKY